MNGEVRQALETVIEYNWDEEIDDAVAFSLENGHIEGHVFKHLVTLSNYLWDKDDVAEDVLQNYCERMDWEHGLEE